MNITEKELNWAGQPLLLTNQRVIYWPKEETLILSDLHIGKAAHFRKSGIAIPTQTHQEDLVRLAFLIAHFQAKRVIIVGDLLHAGENSEVSYFKDLISNQPEVQLLLVKGNHDRLANRKLHALGINSIHDHYIQSGIHFLHQPLDSVTSPQIVGHIHPGINLKLPTQKHLRLPAYIVSDSRIILPAYCRFTGLDSKQNLPGAIYYAIHETDIFEITV